MGYSNSYVQDGAASNNREFGGSMNLQGLESVGEVRVETSTSSAKYNTPPSVIVSTKSGTNKLRISAYETARNNAFGVARARQDGYWTDSICPEYGTAMALIVLQTPNNYLPIFQR